MFQLKAEIKGCKVKKNIDFFASKMTGALDDVKKRRRHLNPPTNQILMI